MAEITLEDLQKKQEELMALVTGIQAEQSGARIAALAPQLQAKGAELEELARRFEAQERARLGNSRAGATEVVLTAAQQERVRAETGVTLETLVIADEEGVAMETMPVTDPRVIEVQALEEARRRKAAVEAAALVRAEYDRVAAVLEANGHGARLAELRADPKFLGGILKK